MQLGRRRRCLQFGERCKLVLTSTHTHPQLLLLMQSEEAAAAAADVRDFFFFFKMSHAGLPPVRSLSLSSPLCIVHKQTVAQTIKRC